MVLGTRGGALVVVSVRTVPASVAGQLGILGGGTAMAIMGDPDDDYDAEVEKWEKKLEKEPRRQRISDANKLELENSGWLKKLMPDAARRRQFMKWLERRHGTREGIDYEHLRPGSPEAAAAVEEFNLEEP